MLGWRASEEGLFLRVRGQTDDVRLVCRCDRSHFLIRESLTEGRMALVLVCHHCGTRVTFVMEGVDLPRA